MPFAELDGHRVYYEAQGSGDAVLLLNGLGADHTAWSLLAEALQPRFRVVTFDNPGVGQTEGPAGPYTAPLFADVAAGLARSLEIDRAHVVGASMGGLVAQHVAVRHPELVRSLVLHCPWWRPDRHVTALVRSWQAIARAAGMRELVRQIWLWVFTPRYYEDHPEAFAELERLAEESPFRQSAEQFCDQAEACVGYEPLEAVSALAAPTLITVGERDILTPPAHSVALHQRIPASTLHVWPEMGHAPFWEIPEEFNGLNRNFLEAHR